MGSFLVDDSTVELLVNEWAEETAFQAKLRQQTLSKMPVLDQQGEQYNLVFDGIDDELAGDIQSVNLENCNIYLVLTPDVSLVGTYVFQSFYDSGNQDDQLFLSFGVVNGKPTVWVGDGATNIVLTGDDDIVNSVKQIWSFKSSGTTKEFFINNDLIATQTSALSATVNRMRLGSGGNEHFSPCSISSTPIYSVAKNTAQQYNILDFLLKRFGLSDFLPPVVGNNGQLIINVLTDTTYTIGFVKAVDNVYALNTLIYKLYVGSTEVVSDIDRIENEGSLVDFDTNVTTLSGTGGPGQTLHGNILVEDPDGNKSLYNPFSITLLDPEILFFNVTLTKGQEDGEINDLQFTGDIGDQLLVEWEIGVGDDANDNVTIQSLNEDIVTVVSLSQTSAGEGSATLEIQGVGQIEEIDSAIVRVYPSVYGTWEDTPIENKLEIEIIRYAYDDVPSTESTTQTYTTGI